MTGREKIEAAFSTDGSPEIGVVIPYMGIMSRDHWPQFTSRPWWHVESRELSHQVGWRRDLAEAVACDWIVVSPCEPRDVRLAKVVEERPDGVFLVDTRTGETTALRPPVVGGWISDGEESVHPEHIADTNEELDRLIPTPQPFDREAFLASGRDDLAAGLLADFGASLYPIGHVTSPLWACYALWGFDDMMTLVAEQPEIVSYACSRFLAQGIAAAQMYAALGARGIWIEECLTDMISPSAFRELDVPFTRRLVEEIRSLGMKSIYYYCGSPGGKWDEILSIGADALSLEESKKGFEIDIEDASRRVAGRCVVFGNLDAIGALQQGSETELRREVERQIAAGRANGGRFIMSLGSPVTPETPIERVRLYCDLAREIGG